MATIILQAAGSFLGGFLGGTVATIGGAVGGVAGYLLDRALLTSGERRHGPRLQLARPLTAEEGAPVPRVYGTARIGGTLIWATRFEEQATAQRQGGKGGPKVTTYSYFANAAFALCEGEVAGIRRVWADGRELDLEQVTLRLHRGTADQLPDPLIEAKQGEGNAPAYRGIAYVVVERMPVDPYGRRLPQMQFEVIRPVGEITKKVKAVVLIPGSTEFGYEPLPILQSAGPGTSEAPNRHVLHAASDFAASIDELQATCPNLEHVALVASWFGDDLRAGHCTIRPKITSPTDPTVAARWRVSGLTGAAALAVTQAGGRAAYGGTPSDASIVAAIRDLKARGLKVTFYPFVMMDVPEGNALPDPRGGSSQPAYPWRGRITCHPGPDAPGSADVSASARVQVADFFGHCEASDFAVSGNDVSYTGAAGEWSYRRLILHYAKLTVAAGGVDAFLVGSELRGLTTLRDADHAFPAVEALCDLTSDVRSVVGAATKLTYGADWSEYFGHHPADGSGDVFFHLDPLWAHPQIDAIGIDNYLPLSDWRDEDVGGGHPDGALSPYDPAALRAGIAGGEGFGWYYADPEARRSRTRTPITDDGYGKPWVFRPKDLASWWANQHFERRGGVESGSPTVWAPRSKPFWFTELGCPACDKGPNQPNVFHDAKSSESAVPYASTGGRSDLAQRRFLEAHLGWWDPAASDFESGRNPSSPVYGARMVDLSRAYLWAWDCRPFPTFPLATDVWGDGENWLLGHWLNGRLANPSAGDLINALLADHGLAPARVDHADGVATGYVVQEPASARSALDEIAELFGLVGQAEAEGLVFRSENAGGPPIVPPALAMAEDGAGAVTIRQPPHAFPGSASLAFIDPMRNYQAASARQSIPGCGGGHEGLAFSGALDASEASARVTDWLRRRWSGRDTIALSVPAADRSLGVGAVMRLAADGADYVVTGVEEGLVRRVEARRIIRTADTRAEPSLNGATIHVPAPDAPAVVHFMDLPSLGRDGAPADGLQVAASARSWKAQQVYASAGSDGYDKRADLPQRATAGRLLQPLPPGFSGRLDRSAHIEVSLLSGELQSVSMAALLNGSNAAAVRSGTGAWEVLQFAEAEEIAPEVWRLSGLLRGQLGTEDAMFAGAGADAPFVVLDSAVRPAGLRSNEAGLPLNWMIGPAGADFGGPLFNAQSAAGGLRAAMPLAPVHVRPVRSPGGDVALTWIRRSRVDGDAWGEGDIPLGEEGEAYLVDVINGTTVLRTAQTAIPAWTYAAAMLAADFPGGGTATFRVRQGKGASGAPGLPAETSLTLA